TGNMKFALNGALTIGTLDGANVEIAQTVGDDNIFIFGLTADEVAASKERGYDPGEVYESSSRVRRVIDFIQAGKLCPEEPGIFNSLIEDLLHNDRFMLLADFDSYVDCQARVDEAYLDQENWA